MTSKLLGKLFSQWGVSIMGEMDIISTFPLDTDLKYIFKEVLKLHRLYGNQYITLLTLTGRCWHEETACRRCSHTAGR